MAVKSRRNLIKGLGISIPTAWVAPIIEAVILPAHADTSSLNCLDNGWTRGDPSGTGLNEVYLSGVFGKFDSCEECYALVQEYAVDPRGSQWDALVDSGEPIEDGHSVYAATWGADPDDASDFRLCYAETALNTFSCPNEDTNETTWIHKCLD